MDNNPKKKICREQNYSAKRKNIEEVYYSSSSDEPSTAPAQSEVEGHGKCGYQYKHGKRYYTRSFTKSTCQHSRIFQRQAGMSKSDGDLPVDSMQKQMSDLETAFGKVHIEKKKKKTEHQFQRPKPFEFPTMSFEFWCNMPGVSNQKDTFDINKNNIGKKDI